MYNAAEINTAIAQGFTVLASSDDLPRRGQPGRRGVTVELTQAFDANGGTIRAYARGYRGRFRVTDVRWIAAPDTTPDSY